MGEKARSFHAKGSQYRSLLGDFDVPPIGELDRSFSVLLSTIRRPLRMHRKGSIKSARIRQSLGNLNAHSPEFFDYFASASPAELAHTLGGVPDQERLAIKMYLSYVAHSMGRLAFAGQSYVLSSSPVCSEAIRFAGRARSGEGMVLVAWKPTGEPGWVVDNVSEGKAACEAAGIPTLVRPVYPEQEERSFVGGVFPHYLLCYFDLRRDKYVVSPLVAELPAGNVVADTLRDGLPVPFSGFLEWVRLTNYERAHLRTRDGDHQEYRLPTLERVDAP